MVTWLSSCCIFPSFQLLFCLYIHILHSGAVDNFSIQLRTEQNLKLPWQRFLFQLICCGTFCPEMWQHFTFGFFQLVEKRVSKE